MDIIPVLRIILVTPNNILENDYFIVGCPQMKGIRDPTLCARTRSVGLVAIFKFDSDTTTYVLKDINTLIDIGNADDTNHHLYYGS